MLASRAGQVVTREEIRQQIWGDETFVDLEQGLGHCIRQIRTALGDDADNPRFIETLTRRGYRFIAPVEAETAPLERRPRAFRFILPGAALIAAVLGGLLAFNVYVLGGRLFQWGAAHPKIESIAVLPLENLSGDKSQDYFAEGMTEELITDLGEIRALRVISRTSVMQYQGTTKPLPQIARELNVDAVLEGAVLLSGDLVRITVQLVRINPERQVWAESYDRSLRDVLALQSDVAMAIARHVRAEFVPQE